jgi:hypothetical protein
LYGRSISRFTAVARVAGMVNPPITNTAVLGMPEA